MIGDENEHHIGVEVKRLRTERGLTLRQLADRTDSHPTSWSQIETGSRKPSLPMLERAAEALGVHPGDFWPQAKPTTRHLLREPLEVHQIAVGSHQEILTRTHALKPNDVISFAYNDDPKPGQIVLYQDDPTSELKIGIVGEHPIFKEEYWAWPVDAGEQPLAITDAILIGVAFKMERSI